MPPTNASKVPAPTRRCSSDHEAGEHCIVETFTVVCGIMPFERRRGMMCTAAINTPLWGTLVLTLDTPTYSQKH